MMKDYEKAIFNLNQALLIDKLNPTAYYIRGWVLKETGDTIHAVEAYKKAIELKSDYEQPFEELGLLYAQKGDRLAVEYLSSTININPKNIQAMYALGLFYQEHGAIQQALDLYKQILDINPNYINAINNVGYINLYEKKQYEDAIACFDKVIAIDSSFLKAWLNRASTYEAINDKQKAKADYKKVLEIDPKHEYAKQHFGEL
jgi:superkiller protein 3